MGNQILDSSTDGSQSSYSILTFPGSKIPPQYKNMILSRWLRSHKQYNDYFRLIDKKAYYDVYPKYVDVILERPNTQVKIAALTDDKDVCLGFSVVEGATLHYCHVQDLNRRLGIGTNLIPKEVLFFTHMTRFWLKLWNKKYPHAKFNPFI